MSEQMDTIFALRRPRQRGCKVCGNNTVAVISIQIRELAADKSNKGRSKTLMQSLCHDHAIQMFEQLQSVIEP